MKRALQYCTTAAILAAAAVPASGARAPAFAEDRPCYRGTPQVCHVQEICTEKVVNYTFWPPGMTTTCLSKVIEYYYWAATSTSGGGSTAPGTTQPSTSN